MANKKALSLLKGIAVTGTTIGGVSVFTDVTLAMSAELEDVQAEQMSGELYIQIEEETLAEECNIEADTDVVNTEDQNLETEDEIDSIEDVIDVETDFVENNTDSDEDNVILNQSPVMMRTLGNVRLMAASITPENSEIDNSKSDAIQTYGDEIRNASEEDDVTDSVIGLLSAKFDIDAEDDTTGNIATTEIDGKTVYVVTDSEGIVSYYLYDGIGEDGVINFDKVEITKGLDNEASSYNLSTTKKNNIVAELDAAGLIEGEDYIVEENIETFVMNNYGLASVYKSTEEYIRANYTSAKWNNLVSGKPSITTKTVSYGKTNTALPEGLESDKIYVGVYRFSDSSQPIIAYYRKAVPVGGSTAVWGWYKSATDKGTVIDGAGFKIYVVGAVDGNNLNISNNTYNVTVYTNVLSDVEGDISFDNSTSISVSESESTITSQSLSESESTITSQSLKSESESIVTSQSASESESIVTSQSASESESIASSESLSTANNSESELESKSASESLSTAKSESESASMASESASLSASESGSESASISNSLSDSTSQSIIDSLSNSTSERINVSLSNSTSESIIVSLSSSTSESIIVSLSTSTSESIVESLSNSISASESASESISESLSDSMSDSSNNYTSDGGSDSTTSASEGNVAQSYTDIDAFTSAIIRDDEVPLVGDFLTDNTADIDFNNTVAIASEQAPIAAQVARVPLGVINEFEDEEELYTSIDTEIIEDEETALGIEDISSGRVWWHWTLIIIGLITGTVAYDKRRREFVNIKNR